MLAVNDINLSYGASQALWGVSLTAEPGKVTCLMGRNGVGKTSTLRAIVGQQATKSGSITLDGKPVDRMRPFERAREGIAFVPQGREIFPLLTVRENLETGYACVKGPDRHVSEELFDLFPVLKTMLGRRGGDLSGGQQQQLAIARALVTRPRVLLLDEPTEGIQPSIIQDIGRVISLLRDRGDMAILLVEQYFEFAKELADTFHVMDRGEIVLSGKADEMDEDDVRAHLTV